jgi:hypothetical protein
LIPFLFKNDGKESAMPSYKERYNQYKEQVDAAMGRPLGRWGRIKAFFGPDTNFSDARKAAIDRQTAIHQGRPALDNILADRLYQPKNIIGTTGQAPQQPTVYYRTNSGTFGHITQEHNIAANVGRMKARKAADYTIGNTRPNGAMEERAPSLGFYHPSRNPFRTTNQLSATEKRAAQQAPQNFPHFKGNRYS